MLTASAAELMIRRQIKTRLPIMMMPNKEKVDREIKAMPEITKWRLY